MVEGKNRKINKEVKSMKKKILVTLMISLVALAGCSKAQTQQTQEAVQSPTEETNEIVNEENEEVSTNIGNPWVECTEDDILDKFDYYMFAPDDAKDVKYQLNEVDGLAQMTFKHGAPELEYTYRVKKTSEFEDISGLYYDWTVDENQQVGWCDGVCKRYVGDAETVDLCMWYDPNIELMHSLSTSAADLDGYDIVAMVSQFFLPEDESEIFMPANFLEARLQKDIFESFDEIIGALDKGNAYAIVKVNGLDEDVLMITESTYDNLDGNMVTIDASVYRNDNGKVINIGNVISSGTAYPISLDADGRIYTGGNHDVSINVIADETKGIMSYMYAYESFDEDQNVTYGGFVRSNNNVYEEGKDIAKDDPSVLNQWYKDYAETKPINFTVVE